MSHSVSVNAVEPLYFAREDVVASDIGDHWALLDLETSMYYTLNATGATVWNAMQSPTHLSHLIALVTEVFSVSEEICRPDIEAILQQLLSAGLVIQVTSPLDA